MNREKKYVIISPVRNEASNIEKTILSVVKQTVKPIVWVIADDGSTDETKNIIEKYLSEYPWIRLYTIADRGYYDLMTGGEIRAFYHGYEQIKDIDFDFIAKLDGDISFDENYFQYLFHQFDLNSRLGIASGSCYHFEKNKLVMEKVYKKHVRGAARIYKKECWDDIGGVIKNLGWDAIDVYKARMLGWQTRSFKKIKMIHHVKTWTKGGIIHGRQRSGRMEYLIGTHPLFFIFKVIREFTKKPYIISCLAYSTGYLKSMKKKERRVVDKQLMNYIRREQVSRIFGSYSKIFRKSS